MSPRCQFIVNCGQVLAVVSYMSPKCQVIVNRGVVVAVVHLDVNMVKRTHQVKLTFRQYPAIHTNYIISYCTTIQYNHNIWHCYIGKKQNFKTRKIMNSTVSPSCHFCMNHQGLTTARPTRPAYIDMRNVKIAPAEWPYFCCIHM